MKKPRQIPVKTRRLTRAEAARIGVSFKAKNRVSAAIPKGKATKRTARYTDREVENFRLSSILGKHTKKERVTQARISRFKTKAGSETLEFKNLSKAQLFKLLKKYKKEKVRFKFGGGTGGATGAGNNLGAKYDGHDIGDDWYTSHDAYEAEEAMENFDQVLEDSGVEDVKEFGLVIFDQ